MQQLTDDQIISAANCIVAHAWECIDSEKRGIIRAVMEEKFNIIKEKKKENSIKTPICEECRYLIYSSESYPCNRCTIISTIQFEKKPAAGERAAKNDDGISDYKDGAFSDKEKYLLEEINEVPDADRTGHEDCEIDPDMGDHL